LRELKSWALLLEYDGTPYVGWQRQASGVSIQAVLEDACARLNGGEPVAATAAGRTDAGVHAAGQVVQVALPDRYRADQIRDALNFHLKPHPIVVIEATPAAPDWSPRFDAVGRAYAYRFLNRRARPALALHRAWHVERRRLCWWADTIFRHSARVPARPGARSARWIGWTPRATATCLRLRLRHEAFCITRCATWWAR